ncbi:MAG: hypothetical protein KDE27_09465, partial [Planctomycetes bacterium]|nr:hypothetical protein [Planctomycetota bacterium]
MNEVRDASTARRGLLAIALLLAAAALLGLGIADFWPWISDDSFIALRYSRRLLAGEGLTWDAGPPVEGYSNLLWILLCAALRLTGLGWVATARVLGIAATLATFVVLLRARVLAAPAGAPSSLAARACILPLAALAPVALWAIGGLEGPLAMLLVAYVFVRVGEVLRDPTGGSGLPACRAAGIALFFLALCRSEGPLWGGFAGLGILLFARSGPAGESGVLRNRLLWRRLLWLGVPMTIAVLGHLAFRLAYYGEWVPNTAHAKLGTSPQTLAIGLLYVGSAAHVLKSLWIPAAIGALLALFDRRTRGLALITAAAVATWTTYVGLIGGDWYPLCRYLQASYGLLALLVGLGLRQLARWQIGGRPIGSGLAWASAIAAVVVARLDARLDPEDPYQVVSHWEWRG